VAFKGQLKRLLLRYDGHRPRIEIPNQQFGRFAGEVAVVPDVELGPMPGVEPLVLWAAVPV
jgi:hypothetical protein